MSHIKKLISDRTGKVSFRVHIRTNQKTITKTFKLKKDALAFSRTIEGNTGIKDSLSEPLLNQTYSARIKSVERLRYYAPGEWGKILGLDWIPEVRTLRKKLKILSQQGQIIKYGADLSTQWMHDDFKSIVPASVPSRSIL